MLTKLTIRNFKRFESAEIELGNPVVFVGPNNSGKTTALQALALWDIGVKRWAEKRSEKNAPKKRPGVTINRHDLIAIPVPDANLLWKGLHVRDTKVVKGDDGEPVLNKDGNKKTETKNVRIDIIVDAVTGGRQWTCGLEFDFGNKESFYCRPLRNSAAIGSDRMSVPDGAASLSIAFLPPMSGLAANEIRLDRGAINVRLGEGRTAEVLRNLCYRISGAADSADEPRIKNRIVWPEVCGRLKALFGVDLDEPRYIPERGEIAMTYRDSSGVRLDLSAAGRGLQQTLLLIAHLELNPGAILLIDEPDAHLEVLRQREMYSLLSELARDHGSQLIVATHSEIVLNDAAGRDTVVAFVGSPHRIDDRGQHVLKSLKDIGFDQYFQAEQTGWILYLEGSTDLAILCSLAEKLKHPARESLERPFVQYVGNQPNRARSHFFGLKEAKTDLLGFALFDHLEQSPQSERGIKEMMWARREIENYLCQNAVLIEWTKATARDQEGEGSLFVDPWIKTMETSIADIEQAMNTLGKGSPWSPTTKVTDDFLNPLFRTFFKKLNMDNQLVKSNYHVLAQHIKPEQIDPEVTIVLDAIWETHQKARPTANE
ncbi:MAG: AAA family ATPase [Planctomycetaceae bacterium]|nr:AAA family ATPase [Planctomycetaceae bacterium]